MKRLCFSAFANVLAFCTTKYIKKLDLLNCVVQSVDKSCSLSSNAAWKLLNCEANLPNGRANALGAIISNASSADPILVTEYYLKKVIPLIDPNKRKLIILALRDIIAEDETINDDTVVDIVTGTTKKTLLSQSRFVLSDFLAGIFLYTASIDNREGKETIKSLTEEYVLSFESENDTISLVQPSANDTKIEAEADSTDLTKAEHEKLNIYMKRAVSKYSSVKTLLYSDRPRPFYSFYVPNDVASNSKPSEGRVSVSANSITKISNFLIITGTGGSGKSMMMRHLLLNAVCEHDKNRLIPILIDLKDYGKTTFDLFNFVYSKVAALNRHISEDIFSAVLNDGSVLLLFDGLDEVDGEMSDHFEWEMETFTDQYPKNYYIITSRPVQSFISFGRFSTVKICPFTKEQALLFVDKMDYWVDQPEMKDRFRCKLSTSLYDTHRIFAENPLMLTIMLLTFELHADLPLSLSSFYQRAFATLTEAHDSTKGSFTRRSKTGLRVNQVQDLLSEICFRSYSDQKYEFTNAEFDEYLRKSNKTGSPVNVTDFLNDLCSLSLMIQDGGKHEFVHRTFLEYFATLFMSRQSDIFISKLGNFFEARSSRRFPVDAFSMLYDMAKDRVEEFIFIPYLTALFDECDSKDGYWTFLEKMYPVIRYEIVFSSGISSDSAESFLFYFISQQLDFTESATIELPYIESLVTEKYLSDPTPNEIEAGQVGTSSEPKFAGWKLEIDTKAVHENGSDYSELLRTLDDDDFIYKKEYICTRQFLNDITAMHKMRRDDLLDLI